MISLPLCREKKPSVGCFRFAFLRLCIVVVRKSYSVDQNSKFDWTCSSENGQRYVSSAPVYQRSIFTFANILQLYCYLQSGYIWYNNRILIVWIYIYIYISYVGGLIPNTVIRWPIWTEYKKNGRIFVPTLWSVKQCRWILNKIAQFLLLLYFSVSFFSSRNESIHLLQHKHTNSYLVIYLFIVYMYKS